MCVLNPSVFSSVFRKTDNHSFQSRPTSIFHRLFLRAYSLPWRYVFAFIPPARTTPAAPCTPLRNELARAPRWHWSCVDHGKKDCLLLLVGRVWRERASGVPKRASGVSYQRAPWSLANRTVGCGLASSEPEGGQSFPAGKSSLPRPVSYAADAAARPARDPQRPRCWHRNSANRVVAALQFTRSDHGRGQLSIHTVAMSMANGGHRHKVWGGEAAHNTTRTAFIICILVSHLCHASPRFYSGRQKQAARPQKGQEEAGGPLHAEGLV